MFATKSHREIFLIRTVYDNLQEKKYAISEEPAISWLKTVHFQFAKPLAEKMGLELPEDFVSDNEGKR